MTTASRAGPKVSRKPDGLHDSGFASDDNPSVPGSEFSASPAGSSPPVRTFEMPAFHHTNRDFGTPKARYASDELQLKQPKHFPIIPLASTLARAREEAEAEAEARGYCRSDFPIYEDTEEVNDALPGKVLDSDSDPDKLKFSKVIDSRGRTRAASKRLGLGGSTATETSSEERENPTQVGKKRKRGGAQAAKQPRKQAKKDA